jgi:PAS domain S-box-containing protein
LKFNLKIVATVALAVTLLVLAIALSLWFFKQSEEAAAARKQTFVVINSAENLLSVLKDAETGERGYLIAGDEAFLVPYLAARDSVGGDLKILHQQSLIGAANKHLDALEPLIEAKLAGISRVIELRRNNDEAAALRLVKSGQGKQLMDSIRKEIADFNQIQAATLAQNDADFQWNMRSLFTLIVATSLFSILYAFFSAYLFYRQTQQQSRNLIRDKTQQLLKIQQDTNLLLQQTNISLQASEEEFHALVMATAEVVWVADAKGRIKASPTWCGFTGQSPEEMVGMGWLDVLHPDEREQVLQAWEQAIAKLSPLKSEHRVRCKDGDYRHCILHGVPVLHADGSLRTWIGTLKDVTERSVAEAELKESEHRYHTLFNSIDEGFCILDVIFNAQGKAIDFRYLEVNSSFEKQSGLSGATGKLVSELAPGLEAHWFEIYGKVALTGESVRTTNEAKDLNNRSFDLYAFRIGEPESRKVAVLFSDISERIRNEKMLGESEQRMHLATQATGVGVWEWNVITNKILWDDQLFQIYGIAPTQGHIVDYSVWKNALVPEDLPLAEEILQDTVKRLGQSTREFRIIRADNQACRTIHAVETVRLNAQGVVEWVVGTNLDITERQQSENELRTSEIRYRRLFEAAHDGVLILDPGTSKITDANPFMTQLLGYPHDQLVGKELFEIGLLKDEAASQEMFEKLKQDHEVRYENLPLENQSGQHQEVEVVANLYDEDGQPVIQFNIRDITERRSAEKALRNSQARLALGMQVVGLALAEVDYVTGLYHLSAEAAHLFGFGEIAVVLPRAVVHATFHPDDRAELTARIAAALDPTGTGWFAMDHRVVWPSGEVRWLRVRKQVFFEGEGGERRPNRALIAALDITEHAETEATLLKNNIDLKQAKFEAEKANLAKSEFLSSMSHELRTPLGAILGFAQLIESSAPPPTPTQKKSVEQILKAGWYLLDLINEILDLSVIESGKLSLSMESVSLAKVLHECRDMIEPQANNRGVSVTFANIDIANWVDADHTRLKQIVINLLSNAIKYNKVSGTVDVDCKLMSPKLIRINVRDTGTGLNKVQFDQLFQPFNRLGRGSGNEEGAGIGLVVSKRLVELMGGKIGVESTAGKGSVFWIELNLAHEPQSTHDVVQHTPIASAEAQTNAYAYTLLYVEDNPANLLLVEDIIARRSDIRLLSAKNGNLGIEIARSEQPTIILMDINLPGMNGTKAMRILAQDPATAHIPVIAISANAMPHDIEKGLKSGFFRYLTKPIKITEFMDTLDAALQMAKTNSTIENSSEEISS